MIKDGRAYTLKSENGLGDECDQITTGATMGGIDTAGFMSLVFGWIHYHISPATKTCTRYSSYSLKHMVENDIGYYITNNQFKDAMLLCGYQPVNANETNWLFKIKLDRANRLADRHSGEGAHYAYNDGPYILVGKTRPGRSAFFNFLRELYKEDEAMRQGKKIEGGGRKEIE